MLSLWRHLAPARDVTIRPAGVFVYGIGAEIMGKGKSKGKGKGKMPPGYGKGKGC